MIILNIGADVYLELTYKEAIDMIERKMTLVTKKIKLINDQIIKNKAYVKLTEGIIEQIKSENY